VRPNKTVVEACRILGDVVRFVCDENKRPIRAIVGRRWATPLEWRLLVQRGLNIAPTMQPPPVRSRREPVCPCPGCKRCCCEWVGDGHKRCKRERCVCPRYRAPVRLSFRRVNMQRAEIDITRAGVVLYTVASWTPRQGWDFTTAGDAKRLSLPAVLQEVIRRAGTRFARQTLERAPALAAA